MGEKPVDIKSIFGEALEKETTEERAAYLDKACGSDANLRNKVEALLRAYEEADDIPEAPIIGPEITLDDSPLTEGPGTKIGRYKLLELIGEGGFGVVYMAEQERPISRRVALKIIKLGMDTKQVIARFEAERQALALMDHSNIAKVLDAGATETGRPYFVMEYVKGMPITKYCDQHKLNIEQRLKLFLQVCYGLQHAHQKGIIHRDIKPFNILIFVQDDRAVPKIIDFGIAKAITQPLTEETLFTRQGQLLGTPEYMSPEQADMGSQDIDTRADIYSLGVVLYELLSGALPFEHEVLEQVGFAEVQRILQEEEPPRPSLRLTALGEEAKKIAERRHTQVVTLARRLHRELEWIPLKAMRKERSRRYRSASEVADDILNYLNGAPLIAGPETAIYHVKKFVRKHAGSVATVILVAVALILGFVVSTTMYFRAEKARQNEAIARAEAERQAKISQAVNDFVNNDLLGSILPFTSRDREMTLRSMLDEASKNIEGRFENEPLIEASIRKVLGNMYRFLHNGKAAEVHLERALAIHREQLGYEHPDTQITMFDLAWLYVGDFLPQKQYDKAERLLVKLLETRRRTLGEEHPETLFSMRELGIIYSRQGRYEEAESLFLKALEINRRVQEGETLGFLMDLADMYDAQGRYEEAEPLHLEELENIRRAWGPEHADVLIIMGSLADIYARWGRFEEAEQLHVKILELRRALGEQHPFTVVFMSNAANFYQSQGRYEEAEQLFLRALEISRVVFGETHPSTVDAIRTVVGFYDAWGKPEKAEQWRAKLPSEKKVQAEKTEDGGQKIEDSKE